jgi:hypothetical protein
MAPLVILASHACHNDRGDHRPTGRVRNIWELARLGPTVEAGPAGQAKEPQIEEVRFPQVSAASLLVSHVSIKISYLSASPARTASQTTHFERNETQGI